MKVSLSQTLAGTAVLAGAIAAAVAAPPVSKSNPLRVSMVAATGSASDFLGKIDITITNTSRHTVRLPKWQLPSDDMEGKLFNVSRDGEPVQYTGMQAKRSASKFEANDFYVLKAGESYRTTVDLTSDYALVKSGQYVVTYAVPLQFASLSNGQMLEQANGLPMIAASAPLRLWVDGSDQLAKGGAAPAPTIAPSSSQGVVAASFIKCDVSQQAQINTALDSARVYSENAKGYLAGGTIGARYTTWFGAYTSGRHATASQHFVAIDDAFDTKAITVNCGCNKGIYASVNSGAPYVINVCRYFWTAPNTGTDSRAGTLIHEMSHFNIVADTDDLAYGQTKAKALAISDPDGALRNADSHEYFAENTPFQN